MSSEKLVLRSFNIPVAMDNELAQLSEMSGIPKAHLLRVMISTQTKMLKMFLLASRFDSMEVMADKLTELLEQEFGDVEPDETD